MHGDPCILRDPRNFSACASAQTVHWWYVCVGGTSEQQWSADLQAEIAMQPHKHSANLNYAQPTVHMNVSMGQHAAAHVHVSQKDLHTRKQVVRLGVAGPLAVSLPLGATSSHLMHRIAKKNRQH